MGLQREYDTADLDSVRQKILDLLLEGRTNLKNASIAMGRNSAYLHQFIRRGTPRILAEHDREALAAHLGCAPEELKHDRMPPRRPRPKPAPRRMKALSSVRRGLPEGYIAVPEIDVRAAAGAGAFNEGFEETKEMWFFADPVIRHEFRARPADLRMITIDGDSMEPLLASGDRILIDVGRRIPRPARHLRDLGRDGAGRQADRARAQLPAAEADHQIGEPPIRHLPTRRRRGPPHRPRRLGGEAAVKRFPHAPLKRAQWTGIPTGIAGAVLSALNIGSVAARLAPLRISSVLRSAAGWIHRDLFVQRGVSTYLRSDNGPKFVAQALRECLARLQAQTLYTEPGSP